jgi:DNA repair protein RecN (Recombination protein N)
MLQKLDIRNYAIIDSLTLEPDAHLNTVTGETGAGKSIILGALSLILGERADTTMLIYKDRKCSIEAVFDTSGNTAFAQALQTAELDEEPDGKCIIRREIATSGKSRAFVNDTPVTLAVLHDLTSLLVDLHQQFDHLALQDDHFALDVTDALAGAFPLRQTYQNAWQQYRKAEQTLQGLLSRQSQWQQEADYKQFLYDELHSAAFKDGEIEAADQQLRQVAHTEKILSVLQTSLHVLDEGEQPLLQEFRRTTQQLNGISGIFPAVDPIVDRMNTVFVELRDLTDELSQLEATLPLDPAEAARLQERFDLGYKLLKKHGLTTTSELLELQGRLENDLQASLDLGDAIEQNRKSVEVSRAKMLKAGEKLTAARNKIAPDLSRQITHLLGLVGMPNARLEVRVTPLKEPQSLGLDTVALLLDANKSDQFVPVQKAASGGEMARIMLCIKSLTARAMHLPTLIFDEVDTGISGEAARQVGLLLKDLSSYHQVICITHQPQVAARGSRHYFVFKEAGGNARINTQIRVLQPDERVSAIARMIGGEQPSAAAMENARELVESL